MAAGGIDGGPRRTANAASGSTDTASGSQCTDEPAAEGFTALPATVAAAVEAQVATLAETGAEGANRHPLTADAAPATGPDAEQKAVERMRISASDQMVKAEAGMLEQAEAMKTMAPEPAPTAEAEVQAAGAAPSVAAAAEAKAAPKQRRKLGRNRALRMSTDPFSLQQSSGQLAEEVCRRCA